MAVARSAASERNRKRTADGGPALVLLSRKSSAGEIGKQTSGIERTGRLNVSGNWKRNGFAGLV